MDTTGTPLGKITAFTQDKNVVNLTGEHGGARITFLDDSTFRVEADPSGTFTDPANTDEGDPARTANIVVGKEKFSGATPTVTDGATMVFKTAKITLELNKATATFRALRADGSLIFAESSAITFGKDSTTEHLQHQDGEQFIGGGMQNGRSVHTGAIINVARNYDWDDDGYPNAVPYYMSSKGYGVLRNTFAPGSYDFGANPTATHQEKRFDAYYFVGDYKQSLNAYTTLTGRPLMPPVYALEYGDADCYNRSNPDYSSSGFGDPDGAKQRTPDAIKTAKKFVENDMPAGWMLVNDGYGCEYQQLPEAVADINKQTGLQVGLWTQRSLSNQAYEVGEAGVRMRKLDVAWVGEGYRQALTGCQSAHDGIEQYSDARGTALMVEGWAGAQRCGMQWTGDHTGNLDAIRWQVSALTGAGNSGLAFTTGDVDGIFGGSAESYVRDLQWKAFAPALYSMSGWAQTDKRPWLYGDEATKINRNYLRLRQQLMPFIYTLAQESSATGVSMMRSMPLEYPEQELSYGAEANNQFMLGDDFLVAPVFTDSTVRNGIFLPAGEQWVDYWSGKVYQGGQVLNGYNAPLDTLPVFVKAGAVVPQGIVARNASLVPENSAITLDVYAKGNNSFTLYEDDKVTRAYKVGKASRQQFDVSAPGDANGAISVTIGQRKGDYAGKSASRPYELKVHAGPAPKMVKVGGTKLSQFSSKAAYDGASTGWFFDPSNAGVIYVKAGSVASGTSATVQLLQAGPLGGKNQEDTAAELRVTTAKQVFQNQDTTFTAEFVNSGKQSKSSVVLTPELPAGWTLKASTGATATTVAGGASVKATFVATPSATSKGGPAVIKVTATYESNGKQSVSSANTIDVAYGSLASAFNSVSVTTVANKSLGDFDGGGATFSAEQLASAAIPAGGVTPGKTVTVNAGKATQVDYTWPEAGPDVPNAAALNGQTIAVKGQGTHLAVLGSAAVGAGISPTLTLNYADGTSEQQSIFFPNWLQPSQLNGAVVAISEAGRNNASGPSPEYTQYKYQVFSNVLRLNPNKELVSVVLPTEGRVKFFDWKVTTQPMPEVPHGEVYASETPWLEASTGWGVIGKNVANKDDESSPDVPLTINYTDPATGKQPTYAKGLGVHAVSKITYYLGGKCSKFTSEVGLESGFAGTIIFKVKADGADKYQSRTYTPGFAPESVSVDLTGVNYVDLVVEPSGSIDGAHGIWGDAKFMCAP